MKYRGSCHCGQVRFTVEGELPEKVLECNCSICRRRAHLLWFVPREQFRLETPETALATYTHNKHVIRYHFCPKCGISTFARGDVPRPTAAINVRCLDGVDPWKLEIEHFDGASR
jgi:hypothetical protein